VELSVETLRRRGKIVIVGIGKSGNIGRKIAATLTSTGSTSVVLDSVDALMATWALSTTATWCSRSAILEKSEELLHLLPAMKRSP